MDREQLFNFLAASPGFASSVIQKAFTEVDRRDFVPDAISHLAYLDQALPIGGGATISQPTVVLFMLNQLDIRSGQKVLDIGSGSGWTTALLSAAVGAKGRIYGVEMVPELVKLGRDNLSKYPLLKNWEILPAGPQLGLSKHAPFDRILVSAAAGSLPPSLLPQLNNWGIMVLPVASSVVRVAKEGEKISREDFPGFVFVPLV
ncbi:MAG: protein-L-isoaspartate O-methyltransferase family protein [Candidatus Saccharibacteria bacterium]